MKKIKEQIDYGSYRERMDPNLERKLGDPEGLYAKNPAMTRGVSDVERLVKSRFKKVADKLREVTGINDLSSAQVRQMFLSDMMNKTQNVMRIERNHLGQLEELAKKVSLEETQVPSDLFIIEAHLGQMPSTDDFRINPENDDENDEEEEDNDGMDDLFSSLGLEDDEEEPSFDVDDLTDEEELELEKHKRNIMNAIVQGMAKKAHWLFLKPDVKKRLDAIDSSLYPNYLFIMAVNDFFYFTNELMIDNMSRTGSGVAGKVKLKDVPKGDSNDDSGEDDSSEDTPDNNESQADTVIEATGLIFPILCHEIVKGIEDAKSRHSESGNPEIRRKVRSQVDTLTNEPMQLRIGPEIVERIRMALPDAMFEEGNEGLINWFHILLYQIPAEDFLKNIKIGRASCRERV